MSNDLKYTRSTFTRIAVAQRDHGVCQDCETDRATYNTENSTDPFVNPIQHAPQNWFAVALDPDTTDIDNPIGLTTICASHLRKRNRPHSHSPKTKNANPNPYSIDNLAHEAARQDPYERPTELTTITFKGAAITRTQVKAQAKKERITADKLNRRLIENALRIYLNPPNLSTDSTVASSDTIYSYDDIFPEHFNPRATTPEEYSNPPRPIVTKTIQRTITPAPNHSDLPSDAEPAKYVETPRGLAYTPPRYQIDQIRDVANDTWATTQVRISMFKALNAQIPSELALKAAKEGLDIDQIEPAPLDLHPADEPPQPQPQTSSTPRPFTDNPDNPDDEKENKREIPSSLSPEQPLPPRRAINEILQRVLTIDAIPDWWETPLSILDNQKPVNLIQIKPDELLSYVRTYLDQAFS